jgi:HlyD family secretion protein
MSSIDTFGRVDNQQSQKKDRDVKDSIRDKSQSAKPEESPAPVAEKSKPIHILRNSLLGVGVIAAGVFLFTQFQAKPENPNLIESSGRIESDDSRVASLVPGRVATVLIHEGDAVRKGQELLVIDDQILAPSIEEAKKGVEIAEQMVAKSKAQVEMLKQQIAQLSAQSDRMRVTGLSKAKAAKSAQLASKTSFAKASGGAIAGSALASENDTAAPAMTSTDKAALNPDQSSAPGESSAKDSALSDAKNAANKDSSESSKVAAAAENVNGSEKAEGNSAALVPLTSSSVLVPSQAEKKAEAHKSAGGKALHVITSPLRIAMKPLQAINPAHIVEKQVEKQIVAAQAGAAKMQANLLGQVADAQAKAAGQAKGLKAQIAEAQSNAIRMQANAAKTQAKMMTGMLTKMQGQMEAKMQAQAEKMQADAAKMQEKMQAEAGAMQANALKGQARSLSLMLSQASGQVLMAEAELTKARGMRDQLLKKQEQFKIVSPIDGVCSLSAVQPGDVVSAGRVLLTVMNPAKTYMRAFVPEGQIARVKIGEEATVKLDTGAGKSMQLKAHVTEIDPVASFTPENVYFKDDRVRQVFGIKLSLDNADGSAKPGMPADAAIVASQDSK